MLRWTGAGMALAAQALRRERVVFQKMAIHATASPKNLAKKSFEQRVARTRVCPRAKGTNHSTRTRDPRERVTHASASLHRSTIHANA